jgi:hypothetical protein
MMKLDGIAAFVLLPTFIAGIDIKKGALRVIDVGVQPAPELIYVAHSAGRGIGQAEGLRRLPA